MYHYSYYLYIFIGRHSCIGVKTQQAQKVASLNILYIGLHNRRTESGHRLVWLGHWPSMQNAKLARNPGSNPGDRI